MSTWFILFCLLGTLVWLTVLVNLIVEALFSIALRLSDIKQVSERRNKILMDIDDDEDDDFSEMWKRRN